IDRHLPREGIREINGYEKRRLTMNNISLATQTFGTTNGEYYNPRERIPIVNTPFVDVEAVLLEDSLTGRVMPRIGIKQDIEVSTSDGQMIDKKNYSVWNMTLHSTNARSMSVRFDNTYLPSDAVMYIYNEDTRF